MFAQSWLGHEGFGAPVSGGGGRRQSQGPRQGGHRGSQVDTVRCCTYTLYTVYYRGPRQGGYCGPQVDTVRYTVHYTLYTTVEPRQGGHLCLQVDTVHYTVHYTLQ